MKKTLLTFAMIAMLVATGIFTSCSKDDDVINSENIPLNEIPVSLDIPYPLLTDKDQVWKEGDVLGFYMNEVVDPESGQAGTIATLEYKKGGWVLGYDKRLDDLSQKYTNVSGTISYYGRRQQDDTFKTYKVENGMGNYMMCKNNCWIVSLASDKGVFVKDSESLDWDYEQCMEVLIHADLATRLSDLGYEMDINQSDLDETETIEKDGNFYKYMYLKEFTKVDDYLLTDEIEGYQDLDYCFNNEVDGYYNLGAWFIFCKMVYRTLDQDNTTRALNDSNEWYTEEEINQFKEWLEKNYNITLEEFIDWWKSQDINPSQNESTRSAKTLPVFTGSLDYLHLRDFLNSLSYYIKQGVEKIKDSVIPKVLVDVPKYSQQEIGKLSDVPNDLKRSNWMSFIDDKTPISELVIPGLHDAATETYYGALFRVAKCQDVGMGSAFRRGARIFDYRIGWDGYFHHGSVFCDAASDLSKFIRVDELKTEVLIIEVQRESSNVLDFVGNIVNFVPSYYPDDKYISTLSAFINALKDRYGGSSVFTAMTPYTTMGELRGKIVLIANDKVMGDWLASQNIPYVERYETVNDDVEKNTGIAHFGNGRNESFHYFLQSHWGSEPDNKRKEIVAGVDNYERDLEKMSKQKQRTFAFQNTNASSKKARAVWTAKNINPWVNPLFATNDGKALGRIPGIWEFDFYGTDGFTIGEWIFADDWSVAGGTALSYIVPLCNFFYYDQNGKKVLHTMDETKWYKKMRQNDTY